MRRLGFFFMFLVALDVSAGTANNETPPVLKFQSAQQCRECHREIYSEWEQSWMSRAFSNPVFQQDFTQWKKSAASLNASPTSCLRCHAPVAVLTGDGNFSNPASREGITCTVCHKVAKVRERDDRHFLVMDPRDGVYGAGKARSTSGHVVRHGKALTDSSLCAGCHLDISNGIPLEYTYHEWKTSLYGKQGTQCMDCHMPPVNGEGSTGTHRSHRFEGGHASSTLLKGAATLVLKADVTGERVEVLVTNTGAGHSFPTGGAHPARLVLRVSAHASDGRKLYSASRIYQFEYLNDRGQTVKGRERAVGWTDTTLKPLQPRTENFDLSGTGDVAVMRAELVYELLPADMVSRLPKAYRIHYAPVVIDQVEIPYRQAGS